MSVIPGDVLNSNVPSGGDRNRQDGQTEAHDPHESGSHIGKLLLLSCLIDNDTYVEADHLQTPAAVTRVKELIGDKPDCVGLKIGVKTRGCNGLSYILDYAFERNKMDEEVAQDGVKIFIDKKAQLTLLGTEMDFQETKLAAEFVFNNPNITGTCGCGESFSV